MECIKILKQLNSRKLKGYKYLIIKELTAQEIEEITECGYFIKKTDNGYKIFE